MRKQSFKYFILLLLVSASLGVSAQSTKNLVRKGNKLFEQQKYQDAEVKYRKALEKKPNYTKGKFNLGDAVYQEKNYKEAAKIFSELGEKAQTGEQKANSWYNLGNSLMQQKQYDKSVNAFIQALKQNPGDQDAKYNLAYARKMLKKQQQQKKKQKQNKKDQKKNQDKKKQQKDKKKQDKNKKNQDKKKQNQDKKQDKKDQQKQQPKDQQGDQKKNRQRKQPQQISSKDARRMLDALKNNEKKTLHKLQKQKAKAVKAKANVINW